MKKLLFASIFILAFCVFAFSQTDQNSSCPTIDVNGPAGIPKPGEPFEFFVNVDTKGRDLKLEYVWSVSNGKIIEGQGTPTIKIEFLSDVTANVEVKGFPPGCRNTDSETMSVDYAPEPIKIDGFSDSISKIEKSRIEKVVREIQNDPNAMLYIVVGYKGKTLPKATTKREREINNILVKENGINPNRIKMVRELSKEASMQFWIVPAGASFPELKKK